MPEPLGTVWSAPARPLYESLEPLLDATGIVDVLANQDQVIIKPNLVEALAPPITTPVGPPGCALYVVHMRRCPIHRGFTLTPR